MVMNANSVMAPLSGEFVLSPAEARTLQMHPYCEWFPPLDLSVYEDLEDNIQSQGLLEPIVLFKGQVFDGRHRLKACLEREVAPRFQNLEELVPQCDPIDWILAKNQYRRHLNPTQMFAIVTLANAERLRVEAELRKQAGQQKGGRPKKNLNPKSGSSISRDVSEMHANSTAGKLALAAGCSRYQAEQILNILKHDPALLKEIATGQKSLREARKEIRARRPPPDPVERFESCCKYLTRAMKAVALEHRNVFRKRLLIWLTKGD